MSKKKRVKVSRGAMRAAWLAFEWAENPKCDYCGETTTVREQTLGCGCANRSIPLTQATVDHIKPKSKGGRDHPKNFALACFRCNLKKAYHTKFPPKRRSKNWPKGAKFK